MIVPVGKMKLSELSRYLAENGVANELRGEGDPEIAGCNTLEDSRDGEITFYANPKYRDRVQRSRASAIIMKDDAALFPPMPQMICGDPYRALTVASIRIHGYRQHPQWGMHPSAHVDSTVRIGSNPNIGPGVTVCAGAVIGDNVTLYPNVFIGPQTTLGDDVTLFPNVTIYDQCRLGSRVTIHAGASIGEDGLGYAPVGKKWLKIPQVGQVIIGDDVELGSNCTIDRATLGKTEIGGGTKFSNLIAVGHGCRIGEDCMFVAQVGLAGSIIVGRHVTIAGQAGVVGHVTIGDDAQVSAQAGVNGSVKAGEVVLGAPATPVADARRKLAAVQKLPEMKKRVREMARDIVELKRMVADLQSRAGVADD